MQLNLMTKEATLFLHLHQFIFNLSSVELWEQDYMLLCVG